jgi:hypothetical protein
MCICSVREWKQRRYTAAQIQKAVLAGGKDFGSERTQLINAIARGMEQQQTFNALVGALEAGANMTPAQLETKGIKLTSADITALGSVTVHGVQRRLTQADGFAVAVGLDRVEAGWQAKRYGCLPTPPT